MSKISKPTCVYRSLLHLSFEVMLKAIVPANQMPQLKLKTLKVYVFLRLGMRLEKF